jgi:two-component system response regulator FixJ
MSDLAKVFVVDDDASVRDSISMLLETAGYAVTTFAHAVDFLDVCTPATQGCIILDVNMPGMDGPMLQQELVRRGFQLPTIFLSGQGIKPVTERTLKAGAMDFLIKPVKGSVLLGCVREALAKSSALRN